MERNNYASATLSLDVASYKTGVAVYENGKITQSGTWRLKRLTRFADLYEKIKTIIERCNIEQIVVEDIFKSKDQKQKNAFEVLAECRGIIELISQQLNLPVTFINPIAIKQYMWNFRYNQELTRQQQKERMIKAVCKLGYKLESSNADDEADAIGLLITHIEGNSYTIHNHSSRTRKCPRKLKNRIHESVDY